MYSTFVELMVAASLGKNVRGPVPKGSNVQQLFRLQHALLVLRCDLGTFVTEWRGTNRK